MAAASIDRICQGPAFCSTKPVLQIMMEYPPMPDWIRACATDDIEAEDLIRFDHAGRTFAIYRSEADEYFCTDGLCTHEKVHLEDGLVMGYEIECPKHNATFDYRTGEALRAPACVALATYPVRVEGGDVFIDIGGTD